MAQVWEYPWKPYDDLPACCVANLTAADNNATSCCAMGGGKLAGTIAQCHMGCVVSWYGCYEAECCGDSRACQGLPTGELFLGTSLLLALCVAGALGALIGGVHTCRRKCGLPARRGARCGCVVSPLLQMGVVVMWFDWLTDANFYANLSCAEMGDHWAEMGSRWEMISLGHPRRRLEQKESAAGIVCVVSLCLSLCLIIAKGSVQFCTCGLLRAERNLKSARQSVREASRRERALVAPEQLARRRRRAERAGCGDWPRARTVPRGGSAR